MSLKEEGTLLGVLDSYNNNLFAGRLQENELKSF